MESIAIPGSLRDVTPEWLTRAFQAGSVSRAARVVSAHVEQIGIERGFTGVVARVSLVWEVHGDGPSTVIVKLPHVSGDVSSAYRTMQKRDTRAARDAAERFAREVRFYHELAPRVADLTPEVFVAVTDPVTLESVMLMENLGHGREGDVLVGCSVSDAEQVVLALAIVHATWWQRVPAAEFDWLPLAGGDPDARQRRYETHAGQFLSRYDDRIPSDVREVIEALVPVYGMVTSRLQRAPQTVIHADVHLDNVLFHDDAERRSAGRVTIIDWQTVSRGPAAIDLCLFLTSSLSPDDRADAEMRLIDTYLNALCKSGVTGYSLDDLLLDYRLALLRYFGAAVIWLGFVDRNLLSGRELAMTDAVIDDDRLFSAVVHHRLIDVIQRLQAS